MNFPSAIVQKSISECEVKEESIRISDIKLPPRDDTCGRDAQPQDDSVNDYVLVNSPKSPVAADYGESEDKIEAISDIDPIPQLNIDTPKELASEVSLISSSTSRKCLPDSCNEISNTFHFSFNNKSENKSPPSMADKSPMLTSSNDRECSPFESSSSYNLIRNQSPLSAIPCTFNIPLPGQSIPSPSLNCNSKSPKSDCSVKIPTNMILESSNSNMDLDSNEGTETVDVFLLDSNTAASAIDIPDVCPAANSSVQKKVEDSKCSPNRLDSDEDAQESTTTKPKVLGKEQAKKRLMAFSLSKQSSTPAAKKQNKFVPPLKAGKEKPPNPNRCAGIQEQFRATISEIEEEKKRMLQNMPNYLLTYAENPNKDDIDTNSVTKMNLENDDKDENKDRSGQSSPVTSKSSRQRRSSSSSSRFRKTAKESDERKDDLQLKKLETIHDWKSFFEAGFALDLDFRRLKFYFEDKYRPKHNQKDRRRVWSPEYKAPSEYKPIFDYLTNSSSPMIPFRAKTPKIGGPSVFYKEKTVKYTRSKPTITWAENPHYATDFCMPKQMLLENCDKSASYILYDIMEQRGEKWPEMTKPQQKYWYPRYSYLTEGCQVESTEEKRYDIMLNRKGRETKESDDDDDDGKTRDKSSRWNQNSGGRMKNFRWDIQKFGSQDEKGDTSGDFSNFSVLKPGERRMGLLEHFGTDEERNRISEKELFVGDMKVKLDVGLNTVKVRSKWDSDYDEDDENDTWKGIEKPEEGSAIENCFAALECEKKSLVPVNNVENVSKSSDLNTEFVSNQNNVSANDSQNSDFSLDGPTGKLASEYEKFMRLVAFGADNDINTSESPFDKIKIKPTDSAIAGIMPDKNSKNIDPTDWDLDSDREDKEPSKKIDYVREDTADRFSLLLPNYDAKNRRKSKSPPKKKTVKPYKKDNLNKPYKTKTKKYRRKSSSESSSDSSDSESDSDSRSDSSDSDSDIRKRKKKKITRRKKKYSSSSTSSSTSSSSTSSSSTSSSSSSTTSSTDSESNSDSKDSKSKIRKKKRKISQNKKGVHSDSNDDTQSEVLQKLDLKKQQIIKKIEEIDSLSIKSAKSKKGDVDDRGGNTESDISVKEEKRKDGDKGNGSFDDESELNKNETKEKGQSHKKSCETMKRKKKRKYQKWSSESSSDDEERENKRTKSAKNFRGKRKKRTEYSSSSDSYSNSHSNKSKKLRKKKKNEETEQKFLPKKGQDVLDWDDHFLSDEPDFQSGSLSVGDNHSWLNNEIDWEDDGQGKVSESRQKEFKEHKDLGDWENSSAEESLNDRRSRESTWDEELPKSGLSQILKGDTKKEQNESKIIGEDLNDDDRHKFLNEFDLESKHDLLIENDYSNLDNDASINPYSSENSASMQLFPPLNENSPNLSISCQLEKNFQDVRDELKKQKVEPSKDELYSPGHTDSDHSDEVEKPESQDENQKSTEIIPSIVKQEIYDPLNSDGETSAANNKIELNTIPLPSVSAILLPEEIKKEVIEEKSCNTDISAESSLPRSDFIAIPLLEESEPKDKSSESGLDKPVFPTFVRKKRMISVKLQQKFQQCKVASVFKDDSDDEAETRKIGKIASGETETASKGNDLTLDKHIKKEVRKEDKKTTEKSTSSNESAASAEKEKVRDSSDDYKENSERYISPSRRSRSPDSKSLDQHRKWNLDKEDVHKEKNSDRTSPQFKCESSSETGSKKSDDVTENDIVRPIPVLTSMDIRICEGLNWGRSHMLGSEDIGYSCDHFDLLEPGLDSFKLYRSQDTKAEEASLLSASDNTYTARRFDRNYGECSELDVLLENRIRKDKRKSRSRSSSPRKRRRSKTPDRRRSPRNRSPRLRSTSPRRRGRSPYSPRRRGSPRSRRYKSSRSPERRKSRSPRKRRHSPSRRSRSISPRKHRDHMDSPRRRSTSPGKDSFIDIGVRNLIQLSLLSNDEKTDIGASSKYDSPMGFTRSLADSTISDSELNSAFYSNDYPGEFGSQNYPEEVTVNNLITIQSHDDDKQTDSPKRLPLDQRIEMELGVPSVQSDQYQIPQQSYQQFPEHTNQYPNTYPCDDNIPHSNSNGNQNFYPTQNSDFNGQYFNGQQQTQNFDRFQQYPRRSHTPGKNSVLQVGNIIKVVPTVQTPPSLPAIPHSKGHQIMQVGNVLQVVPSSKPATPASFGFSAPSSPGKNQKAPAVVVPKNNMPNPEAIINPLIKAIQLEREKRKKEREKRRAEREARRKARQLKREAKIMSVNEKLKKSVQDEGLMLGQEVEEDELLEEVEHPSPPVPVEIITDSSQNSLPPAGKGILITAGFIPKPASEKKEVKFADGVCPGEGTSTSGGEDRSSPPPKPKLPKEKRYKKKKTKVKKKVKVHIIRQVVPDDEDEDDLSPPPPPPGDPPPVFYARFPFGAKAQYPVYRSQTTTTTFTTIQFPSESFK